MYFGSKSLLLIGAMGGLIAFGQTAYSAAEPKAEQAASAKTSAPIAIPAGCPIRSAHGWRASINAMPPGRPRLGVTGGIEVATTGFKAELARKSTDFNPKIVTLELTVTPPASGTIVNPVVTRLTVSTAVPDVVRNLEKVVINCNGVKLTEITDITVLD